MLTGMQTAHRHGHKRTQTYSNFFSKKDDFNDSGTRNKSFSERCVPSSKVCWLPFFNRGFMNEYDHRCQHLARIDLLLDASSGHGNLETIGDCSSVVAAAAAVEVAAFAGLLSLVEVSIAAVFELVSLLLHMALSSLEAMQLRRNALLQCHQRRKMWCPAEAAINFFP